MSPVRQPNEHGHTDRRASSVLGSCDLLHGLRNQGIPLYIDDFGTGYSSLSYLQKMPVDYLKIDQSFVRNITASKESSLIVRSTIELAHDIGLMVVAEGVETQEHWDLLAQFKCDFSQGYFIARPMPAAEFQEWAQLWDARRKNS
jgi:EAL domain-containing protein (putative c-di-GMP-specific phosphodiesterase class I)